MDGAPAEAEEEWPGVPSGEGEACDDLPAEGGGVGREIEPERVPHIGNGGSSGGGLDLRQDIAGVCSWGFNRQAHG